MHRAQCLCSADPLANDGRRFRRAAFTLVLTFLAAACGELPAPSGVAAPDAPSPAVLTDAAPSLPSVTTAAVDVVMTTESPGAAIPLERREFRLTRQQRADGTWTTKISAPSKAQLQTASGERVVNGISDVAEFEFDDGGTPLGATRRDGSAIARVSGGQLSGFMGAASPGSGNTPGTGLDIGAGYRHSRPSTAGPHHPRQGLIESLLVTQASVAALNRSLDGPHMRRLPEDADGRRGAEWQHGTRRIEIRLDPASQDLAEITATDGGIMMARVAIAHTRVAEHGYVRSRIRIERPGVGGRQRRVHTLSFSAHTFRPEGR